jgi:hypothetical protein
MLQKQQRSMEASRKDGLWALGSIVVILFSEVVAKMG